MINVKVKVINYKRHEENHDQDRRIIIGEWLLRMDLKCFFIMP